MSLDLSDLSFHPLTRKLWRDFELLFGERGACGGCWCMYWKLRGKAFDEASGDIARQMQKSIVDAGVSPGLLAYSDGQPVGWIAVEPRSAYPKLAHSRLLQPLDEREVWSITCFYVERKHRKQGVTVALIKAAIEYVRARGGKILEAYPIDSPKNQPDPFVYTGTFSAFQKAGFVEAARRAPTRPLMRCFLEDSSPQA